MNNLLHLCGGDLYSEYHVKISHKSDLFPPKRPIFLYTYATCSVLPPNICTLIGTDPTYNMIWNQPLDPDQTITLYGSLKYLILLYLSGII